MAEGKIKINLSIAGRLYPMTIDAANEELYREAAKRLNDKITEIGYDVDTTACDHRYTRILRLVDIVHRYCLVHKSRGVIIHICCHECCEVKARLRLRICLILDHAIGYLGRC